jgi:hypothetical protein
MRIGPSPRVGARVKLGFALLVAIVAVLLFGVVALAVASPASKYKLYLQAEGKETLADHDEESAETRNQNAEWNWLAFPVSVWIPKYSGPPGQAAAQEVVYPTFDERVSGPMGSVTETGNFDEGEGEVFPFSCSSPLTYSGAIYNRVIVTALDPTIELETDFEGTVEAEEGGAVGSPCFVRHAHGEEEVGRFRFTWGEPTGQRLQIGMLIPPQEIGDPFISGPAQDYNNVAASESAEDCFPNATRTCQVTFKLGGEYKLEKICDGTLTNGSAGSCLSGGSEQSVGKEEGKKGSSGGGKGSGAGGGGAKGKGKKPGKGKGKHKKPGGKGKGKGGHGKGKKTQCVVPNLKGKTLGAAKSALTKAHCALGKTQGKHSGKVKSQTPKAGSKHSAGSKVSIKLA